MAVDSIGWRYDWRSAPRRQLENGVAEVVDQVAGDHRHLALVRLGQVAGGAVQVHRQPAGGLGVEQLRQPRGDHAGEHVAGAAGGHAGIARRVDERRALRASRSPCGAP